MKLVQLTPVQRLSFSISGLWVSQWFWEVKFRQTHQLIIRILIIGASDLKRFFQRTYHDGSWQWNAPGEEWWCGQAQGSACDAVSHWKKLSIWFEFFYGLTGPDRLQKKRSRISVLSDDDDAGLRAHHVMQRHHWKSWEHHLLLVFFWVDCSEACAESQESNTCPNLRSCCGGILHSVPEAVH